MNRQEQPIVRVSVVAIDPPFRPEHKVLFGLQDKRGDVDAVPATETTTFEAEVTLISDEDKGLDVRGAYVHGKRGDRFLYLSWGRPDSAEPYVMFARAKIKFADVPTELLDEAANGEAGVDLECQIDATNAKGQPASGTIKPPAVRWARLKNPAV